MLMNSEKGTRNRHKRKPMANREEMRFE